MVRLALVGGAAIYHARAFSALVNGVAPGKALPTGWPAYEQQVHECRISVVWDEDPALARELAEVFGIDHVAESMDDIAGHCDGVIVADDITLQHQKRAPFFLEQGIPTYIDKPLSSDVEEAESLAALAARHGAPVMSCSALRFAAESAELRANPKLVGEVETATALGHGKLVFYGIHPLELAHSVLGSGVRSVQNLGEGERNIVKIDYVDGRVLLLIVSTTMGSLFQLNVYGTTGWRQVNVSDSAAYYSDMLRGVATMVREKKSPVPIEDSVEVIKILAAGVKSLAEGGSVIQIR